MTLSKLFSLLSGVSPQKQTPQPLLLTFWGAGGIMKQCWYTISWQDVPVTTLSVLLFAPAMLLKGMCEQRSKVGMDVPLPWLEWEFYYYVLRSINGPVYWIFSPPPGDEWALFHRTQLRLASAPETLPDTTLSLPPFIRGQHRSRRFWTLSMQKCEI